MIIVVDKRLHPLKMIVSSLFVSNITYPYQMFVFDSGNDVPYHHRHI